jgi:hypothetical protein
MVAKNGLVESREEGPKVGGGLNILGREDERASVTGKIEFVSGQAIKNRSCQTRRISIRLMPSSKPDCAWAIQRIRANIAKNRHVSRISE